MTSDMARTSKRTGGPQGPTANEPTTSPPSARNQPSPGGTRQDFPGPSSMSAPPVNRDATSVPDRATLKRFITVHERVRAVNEQFAEVVSAAPSSVEATAAQKKATLAIASIIDEAGLSMTEYLEIAAHVEADPALRARVDAMTRPN